MQTLLPEEDFKQTAKLLDYQTLDQQCSDAIRLLTIITKHRKAPLLMCRPIVRMWKYYPGWLSQYTFIMLDEWHQRFGKMHKAAVNTGAPWDNLAVETENYPYW